MTNKRYTETTYRSVRRLMVMLVFAALASCTLIATVSEPSVPTRNTPFQYVCYQIESIYDVPCGDLAEPVVIISDIINDAAYPSSWYGVYYHGEGYVFVNPDTGDWSLLDVILHEMSHYVIWELNLNPVEDECEEERVVREISDGVWDQLEKDKYGC